MLEGILINLNTRDFRTEEITYIKGLKYSIPSFELEHFHTYFYSEIELRLLMFIGLIRFQTNDLDAALEIFTFCLAFYEKNFEAPNASLYTRLHYNLSYTYHLLNDHEKALKHAELGIQFTVAHNALTFLGHLYFRKGVAELKLAKSEYPLAFQYAKNLYMISNQPQQVDRMITACKKFYDIDLTLN